MIKQHLICVSVYILVGYRKIPTCNAFAGFKEEEKNEYVRKSPNI